MTDERSKIIKEHWPMAARLWATMPERIPWVRVAVRRDWNYAKPATAVPPTPDIDILEYREERGTFDGKPAYRVVCEGIVVEMHIV